MKSGLQAVILAAGKGSRMTELTSKMPKCLLPIANKPMIHFPLTMLIEADFTDVIIIIPDLYENEIKSQLSDYKINIEFVNIPYKQDLGTADSLKHIHKKLVSDVLVLSCDLICNYPLRNLINFNLINDSSLCILIGNNSSVPTQGVVPGRKGKFKTDKDIIGVDSQNPNRLVFLNSEVDFEDFISLKLSMITSCPNIDLFTRYLDGHCYILKKYLIDYLINEKNISSIKGEFVPTIIKSQFKRMLETDHYDPYKFGANVSKDKDVKRSVYSYIFVDELKKELDRFDPLIDKEFLKKPVKNPDSLLTCSLVLVDNHKHFVSRSNNILCYYEINKLSKTLTPDHQNTDFGPGRHITANCVIGKRNQISEKTTIKETIIGNNCIIHEKVFLENCLIMDNVVIEEQCLIKNTIICNNAKILKKSKLTDCIIAFDEQIAESSTLANESIVHSDQMIEI